MDKELNEASSGIAATASHDRASGSEKRQDAANDDEEV